MKKPGHRSTRRSKIEEALRLDESRLEALLRLNEMADAPLGEITRFAMEEGVRLTGSRIGYLAFMNEDESVLTMHAWSDVAMAECLMPDKPLVYPMATVGLWGEAVRQRTPIITNNYSSPNPCKKGCPPGHVPIKRHMNLPVFDGRKIVAVAGVGNKRRPYNKSDVRQLQLLMDGMWRLIQRKRDAEIVRSSEKRLRSYMDGAGDAIYVLEKATGRIRNCNVRACQDLGYSRDELLKLSAGDIEARLSTVEIEAIHQQVLPEKGGTVAGLHKRKDGSVFPVEIRITSLAPDQPELLMAVARDVTERKQAEETLQKAKDELEQRVAERTAELSRSRAWLATLFRTTPAAIFLSRMQDGRFLELNDACERVLGYSAREMIGRTSLELDLFVDPQVRARAAGMLQRDGGFENVEVEFRHKSGQARTLLVNALPLDVDGDPCILGTLLDITERTRAQRALLKSEAMLAEAQRITHIGSWEWDLKTKVLYWSQETYRIFGVSPDTFEPTIERFAAFIHPDDREFINTSIYKTIYEKAPYDVEHRIILADGRERILHEQGRVFYDDQGQPIRTMGTACDITERKQAEEALKAANLGLERSAARLRALTLELTRVEHRERRRIAGLLHDHLQQLLVAAKLNMAVVAQDPLSQKQQESVHKASVALDQAIAQSRSLTVELSPPVLREGGLGRALQWLGRNVEQTLGLAVEVIAQDEGGRIDQEFCTVLFNAVRELLLNVLKHAGVKSARVEMSILPERRIRIAVIDRGSGFPREVAGSPDEVKTGLGLLAVRERLESMGGKMDIRTGPGQGSQITLEAPLAPSLAP